jgi:hypothetical protein
MNNPIRPSSQSLGIKWFANCITSCNFFLSVMSQYRIKSDYEMLTMYSLDRMQYNSWLQFRIQQKTIGGFFLLAGMLVEMIAATENNLKLIKSKTGIFSRKSPGFGILASHGRRNASYFLQVSHLKRHVKFGPGHGVCTAELSSIPAVNDFRPPGTANRKK